MNAATLKTVAIETMAARGSDKRIIQPTLIALATEVENLTEEFEELMGAEIPKLKDDASNFVKKMTTN